MIDLAEPASAAGGSDLGVIKAAALARISPPDLALALGPSEAAARAAGLGFSTHGSVHRPAGLDRLAARTLLRCVARLDRPAGVRAFSTNARAVAWRAGLPLIDHEVEHASVDAMIGEVATLGGFDVDANRVRIIAVGDAPTDVDAHRIALVSGLVAVSLSGRLSAHFPVGAFGSERATAHLNSLRLGTSGVELDIKPTTASSLAMVPHAHAALIMPPPGITAPPELIRAVCAQCDTVIVPRTSMPHSFAGTDHVHLVGEAPTDAVRVMMEAASSVLQPAGK